MNKKDYTRFLEVLQEHSQDGYDDDQPVTIDASEVKEIREKLKADIETLTSFLDFYKAIPFKKGNVGFTKKLGDVLINTARFGAGSGELKVVEYVVIDSDGGDHCVTAKELLPSTHATKVLYDKSNKE